MDKRKPRVGAIENEKWDSAYVYQVSIVGSRMREQNRQRERWPQMPKLSAEGAFNRFRCAFIARWSCKSDTAVRKKTNWQKVKRFYDE